MGSPEAIIVFNPLWGRVGCLDITGEHLGVHGSDSGCASMLLGLRKSHISRNELKLDYRRTSGG